MFADLARGGLFLLLLVLVGACAGMPALPEDADHADSQAARGQQLFRQHCASCHATTPDVIVGPSLAGIGATAATRLPDADAATYLKQAILDPESYLVDGFPNLMPTNFGRRLNDQEVSALVAYLLTLE
jgi:mono/diheme cytochrome c family protein